MIGINRSPSCGADTTSREDQEVPGRGIFLEALLAELDRWGLTVPVVGIKASQPAAAREHLGGLLGGDAG